MTAVEWLISAHFGSVEMCTPDFRNKIKQALELEKQQIIDFGVWYSGMEQEKVKKAFERFKNEAI
jgi:hypothetical protein